VPCSSDHKREVDRPSVRLRSVMAVNGDTITLPFSPSSHVRPPTELPQVGEISSHTSCSRTAVVLFLSFDTSHSHLLVKHIPSFLSSPLPLWFGPNAPQFRSENSSIHPRRSKKTVEDTGTTAASGLNEQQCSSTLEVVSNPAAFVFDKASEGPPAARRT
jgi:hypothetical protein